MEKLSIDLSKRIGLLKRIKNRVPRNKIFIIAEAIFNSKIRYGITVYLTPTYEEEDLKVNKLAKKYIHPPDTAEPDDKSYFGY